MPSALGTAEAVVEAVLPIVAGLLPGGGTAVAVVEDAATLLPKIGPYIVTGYEALTALHQAQAPNVPLSEWMAQLQTDALAKSGEQFLAEAGAPAQPSSTDASQH